MNKIDIIFELDEIDAPLHLAKVAVNKGYLSAAIAYLDDIESEVIRLREAIKEMYETTPKPVLANFLHPNDPAFVPYIYE